VSTRRLRVDLLSGVLVRDVDGRQVGRIHDVRADEVNGELVLVEYFLGPAAALARLGIKARMLLGIPKPEPTRVAWDRIDVSDPERPRFLGKAEELL
jgi:hypothetical protein